MLVSMTGYGEATAERDGVRVRVELRAINNRYLRIALRCDGYLAFESRAEELVRAQVRRGTVNGSIRITRTNYAGRFQIDAPVLQGYLRQIHDLPIGVVPVDHLGISTLLQLPGVIQEHSADSPEDYEALGLFVDEVVQQALTAMSRMREAEGLSMQKSLQGNIDELRNCWHAVEQRAPLVADQYRQRLVERINQLLVEHGVALAASDLVRETGLYAERCDISEELVRLRSHCEQFSDTLRQSESNGRKLEFLIQEMVRETNTMGAKANDPVLTQHVVEMKSIIDRMREMVQNVE